MELWLSAVIAVLLIVILILSIKIFLLRKSAGEIEKSLAERLKTETNVLIDISSRDKKMRRLAEALNSELSKLRSERRRFQHGDLELKSAVTNISHDLRTPLTSICGYLDLLDKEEKSDDAERYIKVIKKRVEVLKQLTEELFRYSVITSPEYDGKTELVTINALLEESVLAFYASFQEQAITPNITMPENKVIREVNKAALSRVFSNLISNAIKYSDGDLDIVLTDTGVITFSNTAAALSAVETQRLFDRFYTVENARKSTGLGLSISKILIEQMNGAISAEYEGKRLTVRVELSDM